MKLKLITIGKTNEKYWKEAENTYEARLKKYVSYERKDLADIKKKLSINELKKEEGKILLNELDKSDFVVLLDNNGKEKSSEKFAEFIEEKWRYFPNNLVFIVGGAYGFSDDVYNRSNSKLSLSKMTFSHQMIRSLFLEQCYRAFTIINKEPYHHA
jgi:23S rRNA (pseudouridine1915-N3)-methyltransferase